MRILKYVTVLIVAALTAGCFGMNVNSISGSGKVITESRNVSGFSDVEVAGSAKLIIEQSDTETLSITADDNLMQYLTSDVQGSKLSLATKNFVSLQPSATIIYKLSVKNLSSIGIAGSVVADVKGIHTDSLTVAVSGSGDVTISGESGDQKIAISGSAKYVAENFKTRDASISISGSGQAVLAVSDNLDVHVSGSGDVEYIGNPKVTKEISGSGSVKQRA